MKSRCEQDHELFKFKIKKQMLSKERIPYSNEAIHIAVHF